MATARAARAAPNLCAPLSGSPEAGEEVFVVTLWFAVLKRHAHHLVAGGLRAIPRTFERDEGVTVVVCWELVGVVEHEIEHAGMGPE